MVDRKSGQSMIAAAAIMAGFGLAFYFMPRMMIAIGEVSTIAAALFAAALVGAFFGIFWLRSRFQRRKPVDAIQARSQGQFKAS